MRIAACALLLLFAACAGAQHPAATPSGPVSLGLWCEEVTATLCHATAERCNKGVVNFEAGCQEAARASCVGGRERSVSAGRTDEELRSCVKVLRSSTALASAAAATR